MNHELKKTINDLRTEVEQAWKKLDLEQKLQQAAELEDAVAEPEIWLNPDEARTKNETLAHLNDEIEPWKILRAQVDDLDELLNLGGEDLATELEEQLQALKDQLQELKKPYVSPESMIAAMLFCALPLE